MLKDSLCLNIQFFFQLVLTIFSFYLTVNWIFLGHLKHFLLCKALLKLTLCLLLFVDAVVFGGDDGAAAIMIIVVVVVVVMLWLLLLLMLLLLLLLNSLISKIFISSVWFKYVEAPIPEKTDAIPNWQISKVK